MELGTGAHGGVDAVAERRAPSRPVDDPQLPGGSRLFSEYICDGRYGWAAACEAAFGEGVFPVAICHEWNTVAHLNDYEGSPEARPFSRQELQAFLDHADEQVERAAGSKHKGALTAYRDATRLQGDLRLGTAADRDLQA